MIWRHPDGSEIRIDAPIAPQPVLAVGDGVCAEMSALPGGIGTAVWHGPHNPPPEDERALQALGGESEPLLFTIYARVRVEP